ncbi:MAG: CRISPR-associated endonuclease Cas2 [Hydrogenothermaceae bacterium]|nr:CRISPR-associated endonuclease Cas2 [Hydrogenothermaceae bacterium]
MYVIVCYDITDDVRLNKVRKILKKYLNWVQYSIFEGDITFGKLKKCQSELLKVINPKEDSVYFYTTDSPHLLKKEILGQDKNPLNIFI